MLTSYLAALRSLSRNARLYLISNAIQAVSAGALAIFYTLFLSALGFSKAAIGQTVFFGVLGAALGILPAGWFLDRVGWRATLIWSNLMGGVALLAQWLVPTLPVVSITSFVVGASVAMYLVVNSPLLTATSTPSERTALFGVSTALLFLVGVIGTLLGGALPDWMASSAVQHSPLVVALSPLLRADPHVRAYQLALVLAGIAAVPSLAVHRRDLWRGARDRTRRLRLCRAPGGSHGGPAHRGAEHGGNAAGQHDSQARAGAATPPPGDRPRDGGRGAGAARPRDRAGGAGGI